MNDGGGKIDRAVYRPTRQLVEQGYAPELLIWDTWDLFPVGLSLRGSSASATGVRSRSCGFAVRSIESSRAR
jgi:hypothetical protein